MTNVTQVPTPELDKQSEVIKSGAAGAVQEFYDWLVEQGYVLAKWQTESVEPCPGVRRDWFDESNCEGGVVIKTRTKYTYPEGMDVQVGEVCPNCEGTGEITVTHDDPPLVPIFVQPEQLMADHFGIDRDKIETERRALLDALQDQS